MAEGIIMKALSGFYYVDDGEGIVTCRGRGKLRHAKVTPLVGDRVRVRELGNGEGFVEEILPRRNSFIRPAVANIDQLVVIGKSAECFQKYVKTFVGPDKSEDKDILLSLFQS